MKKEIPSINKRFLDIIKEKGYTGYKLAKEVKEITESKLTHIRSGRNEPSKEMILALLNKFPDINPSWLLSEEGDMLVKNKDMFVVKTEEKKNKADEFEKYKIIDDIEEIPEQFRHWVKPFYPEMKVGAGMELGHYRQTTKYFILVPGSERVEFWVPVEGYSMFPKYNHNDLVGLTEIHYDGVFPGHNYVVSYKSGSAHLKKIVKGNSPETIILRSYNPDFDDKEEKIEKLQRFFKVQMFIGNE